SRIATRSRPVSWAGTPASMWFDAAAIRDRWGAIHGKEAIRPPKFLAEAAAEQCVSDAPLLAKSLQILFRNLSRTCLLYCPRPRHRGARGAGDVSGQGGDSDGWVVVRLRTCRHAEHDGHLPHAGHAALDARKARGKVPRRSRGVEGSHRRQ